MTDLGDIMKRHLCRLVDATNLNNTEDETLEVLDYDFGFTDDEVVLYVGD